MRVLRSREEGSGATAALAGLTCFTSLRIERGQARAMFDSAQTACSARRKIGAQRSRRRRIER